MKTKEEEKNKTKLLALVNGQYSSHTVRVVEICKALRETNKYEIIFSGSGAFMKLVEDAGFNYIETENLSKNHIQDILQNKLVLKMFTDDLAEEYYNTEFRLLKEQKPDIIIRDHFREMAGIVAKQQNIYDVFIQKASFCPYYHFDFRPTTFPKILNIIFPEFVTKPFRPIIEKYVRKKAFKPILKQVKKSNIPINKDVAEGYEADLILLPDEEKLFPFPDKKDIYKFISPLLFFNQSPDPDWINYFVKDPRKKILITGGSSGLIDKTELFIDIFKDRKFAVAIHTPIGKVPKDFYGGSDFNIEKVVPYSDVFITHGGLGSNYLGLKYGVPIIAIPANFAEEIDSHQLEKSGAGLSISQKEFSGKTIRQKLEQIIENPSFKENAKKLSEIINQKNSRELAVKYIEEGYKEFKNKFK